MRALVFPDAGNRDRFFADEAYRAVRKQWFEPSVGTVAALEEMA